MTPVLPISLGRSKKLITAIVVVVMFQVLAVDNFSVDLLQPLSVVFK